MLSKWNVSLVTIIWFNHAIFFFLVFIEIDYYKYINAIATKTLQDPRFSRIRMLLPCVISVAQQFSRSVLGDQNSSVTVPVSLRDVERCVHLSAWFCDIAAKQKVPPPPSPYNPYI
jgi:hypothetical protein